jgi:hypothetical protein
MIRNILTIFTAVHALDIAEVDRRAAEISPAYSPHAGKFFRELEPQDLKMGTGAWPCIFQIDTDFYDYTKFKLFHSTWGAATVVQDKVPVMGYNFGWCQQLSETLAPKNCSGDYYAGGFLPTHDSNSTTCTAYSGSGPSNIVVAPLKNVDVTIQSSGNSYSNLTGVKLTYTGGAPCNTTER